MEPRVLTLSQGVEMFFDSRGSDRCLRTSWHHEAGILVVSMWRDDTCMATLRLERDEVPRLMAALAEGLGESLAQEQSLGEAS